MALKIRLARGGVKKRPFYRIVVAENTAPRDGKFVEKLGSYNPLVEKNHAEYFVINAERAKYWLSVGATLTLRAQKLLEKAKIIPVKMFPATPKKSLPKKKARERIASAT